MEGFTLMLKAVKDQLGEVWVHAISYLVTCSDLVIGGIKIRRQPQNGPSNIPGPRNLLCGPSKTESMQRFRGKRERRDAAHRVLSLAYFHALCLTVQLVAQADRFRLDVPLAYLFPCF